MGFFTDVLSRYIRTGNKNTFLVLGQKLHIHINLVPKRWIWLHYTHSHTMLLSSIGANSQQHNFFDLSIITKDNVKFTLITLDDFTLTLKIFPSSTKSNTSPSCLNNLRYLRNPLVPKKYFLSRSGQLYIVFSENGCRNMLHKNTQ